MEGELRFKAISKEIDLNESKSVLMSFERIRAKGKQKRAVMR